MSETHFTSCVVYVHVYMYVVFFDTAERKRSRPTQDDRGTMPVIENRLQSLITRVGEKVSSVL